jgi:hypothetical protein
MTSILDIAYQVPEAIELVKKDTAASYYAANFQFTIGKIVSAHDNNSSLKITVDDLNDAGMKMYDSIQEKIAKGEWENEILENATIETKRSGRWSRNKDHPAHNKIMEQGCECGGVGGIMCSWRNLSCYFTDGNDEGYTTPIIIMYTDDWVYTRTKKLYKIKSLGEIL